MKTITIAGNIGKDAELRTTQGGDQVAGFSVAVEGREGREMVTLWFDVSLWGRRGEALSQYLTKGTKVAVSGDLGTREYNGKTYLTVRASEVTLMGGGQSGGGSGGYGSGQSQGSDPARQAPVDDLDQDEVPF